MRKIKRFYGLLMLVIGMAITCLSFSFFSFNDKADAETQEVANAVSANGGAMYVGAGSTVTLGSDCVISGITGATNGGAIYVAGTLIINGATIENCSAGMGGAIYVASTGTVTMNSGTISGCTATDVAGAIFVEGGGTVTIKGGTISGCSSASFAGAILAESNTTLNISGGTISDCHAGAESGGAVMASSCKEFNFTGGTIQNCSAPSGGGLNLEGVQNSVILGGDIIGCEAEYEGGAIYASSVESITMEDGTISSNYNAVSLTGSSMLYVNGGTIKTPTSDSDYLVKVAGGAGLYVQGGTIGDKAAQGSEGNDKIFSTTADSGLVFKSGYIYSSIDFQGHVGFHFNPLNAILITANTRVSFNNTDDIDVTDFLPAPGYSDYEATTDGEQVYLSSGYTVTIDIMSGAVESGYAIINGTTYYSDQTITGIAEGADFEAGVYVESSSTSGNITTYYEGIIIINGTTYSKSDSGWFIKMGTITSDTEIIVDLDSWTVETPTNTEVEVTLEFVNIGVLGTAHFIINDTDYYYSDITLTLTSEDDLMIYYAIDVYNGTQYPVMSVYVDGELFYQYCNDSGEVYEDYVGISIEGSDMTITVEQWHSEEYVALPTIEDIPDIKYDDLYFDNKKYLNSETIQVVLNKEED